MFTISLAAGQEVTDDPTGSIIFRVTNPRTDKVSYLMGTHHAFGKDFFDSLSKAKYFLNSSDLLIKENLNIPGSQAEDIINQRSTTINWEKIVNKKDLAFLRELFASSPTNFSKMTPAEMQAFLGRYYRQTVCLGRDSKDEFLTLDDYIGRVANASGIEIIGLETIADQIELINKDVEGMPDKVHKRRISATIEKIESGNANDCGEIEWYSRMDIDYKLGQDCPNALLLTNRNAQWMQIISDNLETKKCFIAVGLSHLMFKCGLINQLRQRGYSVDPVSLR